MEINCLKIQEKLIEKLKDEISQIKLLYKIEPQIVFIKCNEDQNSEIFLKKKIAFATQLGIKSKIITEINNEKLLIEKINELNNNSLVHGILIQLPLFKNINNQTVFNSISYTKDVDCLHPINIGNFIINPQIEFGPCTAKGIMQILIDLKINFNNKYVVIINRSLIVGKPLFHYLISKNATVTICHSHTKNLNFYTKNADILIVATGKGTLIDKSHIKKNAIVINVGYKKTPQKIIGDVDIDSIKQITKYYTPIINGVGPLTVVNIFCNLIYLVKKFHCNK